MTVTPSCPYAAGTPWRMRASIVIDMLVGVATLPAIFLCAFGGYRLLGDAFPHLARHVTWWLLLPFPIELGLSGIMLALIGRFASEGQTFGLAAVGLCWRDDDGEWARRRLLGETQFWCIALPALYLVLMAPVSCAQFLVSLAPAFPILHAGAATIMPILIVSALAIMILSRRHPGRLVSAR